MVVVFWGRQKILPNEMRENKKVTRTKNSFYFTQEVILDYIGILIFFFCFHDASRFVVALNNKVSNMRNESRL